MDGDLDDLINALIAEHQTEQLAALAEEVGGVAGCPTSGRAHPRLRTIRRSQLLR